MATRTRWSQAIRERTLRTLARAQLAALALQRRQEGVTAVEYLLVVAVVVVVVLVAVKVFFGAVADKFGDLTKTVNGQ